jgi:hypothetical protein
MSEQTHDAAIVLLRALIDEIKSLAHDPAAVHLVADKLKGGIDALEKALTEQSQKTEAKKE